MEVRHLLYFQAVAEELSYSRASERLHIAQPALSRAVQELEADLGVQLLERNRRHVRLTPAGRVLLHETAILLERWEEAMRRVRRTGSGEEGELRLGYIGPPTEAFFGRLLREYRTRYPLVSIHLEERTPERVWEMLAKGRLSVAITRPVSMMVDRRLRTIVLREERLGAIFPREHPLAGAAALDWKKLANLPLIVLARREGVGLHDAMLAGCRQAGFSPRIAQTPSLIGTVLRYVEAGAGVGIAPECMLSLESPLCYVPLRPAITVPLTLVWPEDNDPPPVQRFRELVVEWLDYGKLWNPGK